MNARELRRLHELAGELGLPAELIDLAFECGLFAPEDASPQHCRSLRQMRRLVADLGVNPEGAALLVRMRRELELLQAEVERLRWLEAQFFAEWSEGRWRELDY